MSGPSPIMVLLSGGVDSAVLVAMQRQSGAEVHTITFDYGQLNARRELAAAAYFAHHYSTTHRTIAIPRDVFAPNALHGSAELPAGHADQPDATEVPGRNMLLLSCAVAAASACGISRVAFGSNHDDQGGYRDCRPEFIRHIDEAAYWGSGVSISAPLVHHTKAAIIELGERLEVPLRSAWSCYQDLPAGPCGQCGACQLRAAATP